jgi:hypothetical protein
MKKHLKDHKNHEKISEIYSLILQILEGTLVKSLLFIM